LGRPFAPRQCSDQAHLTEAQGPDSPAMLRNKMKLVDAFVADEIGDLEGRGRPRAPCVGSRTNDKAAALYDAEMICLRVVGA
jgi:hypothetical protein